MTTGLLIRDFTKQNRTVRYSNNGSILFSEIEKNAYRLILTLEITHIKAPRYANLKTLPENTHYGYATLFRGSTVTDTIAIKYPKFRIFDVINQGIWNYHQATENLQLFSASLQESQNVSLGEIVGNLGGTVPVGGYDYFLYFTPGASVVPFEAFSIGWKPSGESSENESSVAEKYRAFPISSPFPDIVKFKGDVECSFLFRLDAWYLVNPLVYVVDNPTDTSDPTDDEDEYPVPDNDSPFPPSDAPDPDADPRDNEGDGGGPPPPPPQYEGGQCAVAYRFQAKFSIVPSEGAAAIETTSGEFTANGPLSDVYSVASAGECGSGGGLAINDGAGNRIVLGCKGSSVSFNFTGWNILERVDGGLDNCGNPPPVG